MSAPIYDFLKKYRDSDAVRMHMPGHKGHGALGVEGLDLTEIEGADSLYEASGIIAESEEIASEIFGAHTFYSTEGSSLSIRAMVYLVTLYAKERGIPPLILAGRNAHKSFLSAVALTGAEVEWSEPSDNESYLSSGITVETVEKRLKRKNPPAAVYVTSPDYLGNMCDIRGIARVCHDRGALLLVDNAHGAYLKFLKESLHPMDLGADMSSDSAHKTLPVLTGGAYLHISMKAPELFRKEAKSALSLFGSTSPSYLLLASLDLANGVISNNFSAFLSTFVDKISILKNELTQHGYTLLGQEPMKITVCSSEFGYSGFEMAELLLAHGIYSEFADRDHLVLMPSVGTSDEELDRLIGAFLSVPQKPSIRTEPPLLGAPVRRASLREAMLSPAEPIDTVGAVGRIVARAGLACPPAVCILMPGEVVTDDAIKMLLHYGIDKISVMK